MSSVKKRRFAGSRGPPSRHLELTAQDLQGHVHVGDVGDGDEQGGRAMVQRPGRKCGQQLLWLREMLEHVDEEHGTDIVDAVEGRFQRRHVAERARHHVDARE